ERGELDGELVGLVEGRVDRGGEPDPGGDGGERRQHGERVRPAHDVEVVDAAAVLAQPQPLGEEHEVHQPALGVLREVHERGEVGLAAGPGVAPDRGVVDAREVGAQVDLLLRRAHEVAPAKWLAGRGSPNRARNEPPAEPVRSRPRPASSGTTWSATTPRSAGSTSGISVTPSAAKVRTAAPMRSARSVGAPSTRT